MSRMDQLLDALYALAVAEGDLTVAEITGEEAEDLDLLELISYHSDAERIIRIAQAIRNTLKEALAERLGNRAARYGNLIYRNGRETKWRVIDPEGLAAWMGSEWAKVVRLSGDNLRRTALRALAENREISPEAVISTFIEESYTERDLQVMPLEKAPKFLQGLAEGEIRDR